MANFKNSSLLCDGQKAVGQNIFFLLTYYSLGVCIYDSLYTRVEKLLTF